MRVQDAAGHIGFGLIAVSALYTLEVRLRVVGADCGVHNSTEIVELRSLLEFITGPLVHGEYIKVCDK